MKKIISILLSLILVFSVVSASTAFVDAATYIVFGDWLLEVNDNNTYFIGGYTGSETELVFPEKANGKKIIGVSEQFIYNCETEITSVVIPDSFTTIGSYAFYGCATLESVDIPSSLSTLGSMAFNGCTSIASIDLSAAQGLNKIPYGCFSNCSSLSSVTLPENLSEIGNYAFYKTAFQRFDIPANVTSIGVKSFSECSSLTDVTIPNGMLAIGEEAFSYDNKLTLVYVPVSVSSIGVKAFYPMAIEGDGNLIIDCYAGTYAAEYSYENFLNYTGDKTLVKGDANDDGVTNIRDVTYIQLYRVGLYDIGTDAKTIDRVDVTGDRKVTLRDATQIQLYRIGLAQLL